MAHDKQLAQRIRALLAATPGITEKKMFGGVAFLVGGHLAVSASGQGGLLARVDPSQTDELTTRTGCRVAEMRGRLMPGWLRVDTEQLGTAEQLTDWVTRSTAYARSLPAKHA